MIKVYGRVILPTGFGESSRGQQVKFAELTDADPREIQRGQVSMCGAVSSTINGREKVCMYARVIRKGTPVDYNVGVFEFTTDNDACSALRMALLMGSLSSCTTDIFSDVVNSGEVDKKKRTRNK